LSASDLAQAHAFCRRIAEQRGANFNVGFRFLPTLKRRAVYASYAFCRYADDAADHPQSGLHPPGVSAHELLGAWERELADVYAGRPQHPIGLALADVLSAYPIPQEAFAALIQGCREDLSARRYATIEDLLGYCALVAESIGRICIAIFGAKDERAHTCGRSLSLGLQLTNILRDVGEDARGGRCYLPHDELARFGVRERDLAAGHSSPGFLAVMRVNVARAQRFYAEAAPLSDALHDDARLAARLMAGVYQEILRRIAAKPEVVLERTVGLSPAEKVLLVARQLVARPRARAAAG
jgi:phytoene synthase